MDIHLLTRMLKVGKINTDVLLRYWIFSVDLVAIQSVSAAVKEWVNRQTDSHKVSNSI